MLQKQECGAHGTFIVLYTEDGMQSERIVTGWASICTVVVSDETCASDDEAEGRWSTLVLFIKKLEGGMWKTVALIPCRRIYQESMGLLADCVSSRS